MTPAQALFVENDYTIIMINVRDIQFKSYFHTPKRHTWKELHRIIQLFNVPNFYMVTFGKYIFLGKYLFLHKELCIRKHLKLYIIEFKCMEKSHKSITQALHLCLYADKNS